MAHPTNQPRTHGTALAVASLAAAGFLFANLIVGLVVTARWCALQLAALFGG